MLNAYEDEINNPTSTYHEVRKEHLQADQTVR
jgi:hypothetical protein